MSYWTGSGVDDYEITVDVDCRQCGVSHEDIEVSVRGREYINKCSSCGYESSYEVRE